MRRHDFEDEEAVFVTCFASMTLHSKLAKHSSIKGALTFSPCAAVRSKR